MGTPLYMPPEVMEKNINDFSWDMWSVGIMTIMMCTRELPYQFTDQEDLFQQVRKLNFNTASTLL